MKHPTHFLPFLRRFAERCATCVLGVMALLVFISNYGAQHFASLDTICETVSIEDIIALQWQVLASDSAHYIADVMLSLLSGYLF